MKTAKKFLFILLTMLPLAALPQHKPTSYDSDGDGIADSIDKCVLVPGLAQYHGCPYAPVITKDDRDGDGVIDVYDACPDMFGLKSNKGCPDVAMINAPVKTGSASEQNEVASGTSSYNSTSSSEKQDMNDFKNNLLAVLAASGHKFADINAGRDEHENDYKTSTCLVGADECYIDLTQHFFAGFGTYTMLDVAMEKYEGLKQNLIMALGEDKWQGYETLENGMKSFEMKKKDEGKSVSPRVTAYVRQLKNYTYRVYLTIDSKDSKTGSAASLN